MNLVELLRRLSADHGDLVSFSLGTQTHYLLNRPDLVRLLLVENEHCLRKPAFMHASNRGHWGDGLTTLEGEGRVRRRALLRPAFRGETLPRHLRVVAACTADLVAGLHHGRTLDLERELRILTARIAARALFDAEVEGFGTPGDNAARAGILPLSEALGEDFATPMLDDPAAPLVLTRPRAPRRMDETLALLDARLQSGEDRGDMLSFLMRAVTVDGGRLTRDEIVGEMLQMLYAGHLTVPATLANVFRALSRSPEVSRHLGAEAARLPEGFADSGESAPGYFELVVKETMRVFPPAPILYREVAVPFAVDGHVLPAGAAVWVAPALLHHDPRNFPDPERFWPERFDRDHLTDIPEHAYLPFGTGPRTCIGNRLATAQMGVMTALLARRCELYPGEAPGAFTVVERP